MNRMLPGGGAQSYIAKFNLLIWMRGRDCLTSNQNYTSLMRFTNLNWGINDIHKHPQGVNEIHSPVLFGFGPMKGLGHTHKYSTSFIHSFQPQANPEEVGHCMLPYIRDQILELVNESLLVAVL